MSPVSVACRGGGGAWGGSVGSIGHAISTVVINSVFLVLHRL